MEEQTVKDMVNDLLKSDVRCRNDDTWLIIRLWQQKQNMKIFIPYEQVENLIPPSSIVRARRSIQATNKELAPTSETTKKRRNKETLMRDFYGNHG